MSKPLQNKSGSGVLCVSCGVPAQPSSAHGIWLHPKSDCPTFVLDSEGVSFDHKYFVENDVIYEREDVIDAPAPAFAETQKPRIEELVISLQPPYSHDKAINDLFREYGIPKLGGASGDLGWSSFSYFQRCPYLWKRQYLDGERNKDDVPTPLVVGSLFHLFMALHYQGMIIAEYPLSPDEAKRFFEDKNVSAEGIHHAWRIFDAYRVAYENDYITPLAVEHHTVDPKTRESCRYDAIVRVNRSVNGFPEGTYILEHKTASRFDDASLDGWVNDGEVIGQAMLYDRMNLAAQFGPLQGTIVNICGKQKEPKFHRTFVVPPSWQKQQHGADLQLWTAFRQLCVSMGSFPRSRTNCINRFGLCSQWDHCSRKDEEV